MNALKKTRQRQSPGNDSSARWVRGLRSSDAPDSDKALAVFQPDVLIREQFFSTYVRKFPLEPEKILMLAVLQNAVTCFQENFAARERRKRQLFLETHEWIVSEDRIYPYSFENICDALGFAPSYMRRGLMKWKEELLALRSAERRAG